MGIPLEKLAVYAISALLPLERLGAFELAGTTVRPSQLVLLFAVLAVARKWLHDRESFEWRRAEHLLLLLFLAANALSLFRAENFGRSFTVFLYTAFTLLLVPVMAAALREKRDLLVVRNAVLVSAAAVGVFGLWQFAADMAGLPASLTGLRPQYTKAILGFTRVQAASIEPLYFANYLLLPIALCVTAILSFRAKPVAARLAVSGRASPAATPIFLIPLLALLLLNLLLTSSRGGYAAFAASALVIAWSFRRDRTAMKRLAALAIGGAVAAALALQALAAFNVTTPGSLADSFVGHVTTVTDGAAVIERLETFERAVRAWRESPWIGIGVGGYGPYSARFPDEEPAAGWAIVNNEPLELLAETGLLGFLALAAFLAFALRLGARRLADPDADAVRLATLAAVIGIAVQYQTFSTLYIMHVWFALGLLLAAARMRP